MILNYIPKKKILIDTASIYFGENRESVRNKIEETFKEDNQIIETGTLNLDNIYIRRDIYEYMDSTESYFFLSYDNDDSLIEIEVHKCTQIKVLDIIFDFNTNLNSITSQLSKYSIVENKSKGEIFLKDINILLMDKEHMGGAGNTLGYFYCASDVSHLK